MNSIKFFTKKLINLFVVAPIRFILISIKQNKGIRDKTIHSILWNEATNDSAHYVKNFLPEVLLFDNKQSLWDYTISKIEALSPCDILEFGCYKATSINYFSTRAVSILAKHCNAQVLEQYHIQKNRAKYIPMVKLSTGSFFIRKN